MRKKQIPLYCLIKQTIYNALEAKDRQITEELKKEKVRMYLHKNFLNCFTLITCWYVYSANNHWILNVVYRNNS